MTNTLSLSRGKNSAINPSKNTIIFEAFLLFFIAFLCTSCNTVRTFDHQGDVIDEMTREPISGVKIKLTCYKNRLFHGSDLLREIETMSDKNGKFTFSANQLSECSWLGTKVQKEAYVRRMRYGDEEHALTSAYIPVRFFLAKETDFNRLQLEDNLRRSPSSSDYYRSNVSFLEAIKLAKTDVEISMVKRHYCERLMKLWEALPIQDKDKRLTYSSYDRSSNSIHEIKQTDVVKYCEKNT
ncbi:hypothetical protein [Undibacterium sp.]|uniref:hypothetical protein n=1 Tax=Undibacterium sp. TaxID=1914977 RepID=UPI0037514F8E